MSPELLGWGVGFEFAGSSRGGEASCGLPECSSTEIGVPRPPDVTSQIVAKISDPSCPVVSRIREVCSVKFPTGGFGSSVVYLLAGHSGVYVGKARLDRRRMCGMGPRALEHVCAPLSTNVRDRMKPRYRILRRSLGSVFMLLAVWCESEVRTLATEALWIMLESPECNEVTRSIS